MRFSPRLHESIVQAVWSADVERLSIAEVWRFVGDEAARSGLSRPSYHSVLKLVLHERERRAARREAIAEAVEELWAPHGTDYEKLARRLHDTRRP